MSDKLRIISNYHWRPTLLWEDLTPKEQDWFDYDGADNGEFFRYKGQAYSLDDFSTTRGLSSLRPWDGYASDTFFSGIVVRFNEDGDRLQVGLYLA